MQKKLGIGPKKQSKESKVMKLWSDAQQKESKQTPKLSLLGRMELLRDRAGWRAPVSRIIVRLLFAVILTFIITYIISKTLMLATGVCLVGIFIFWTYTQKCISKHTLLFERQLTDALGIAARALRAGHPLSGTFQLIAEEIGYPLGAVFARICQEQTLGLDLKDSIRKVAETTYNSELKLFATAVAIQFQSGGNLADLMDRLAEVIRARMRLNRRVRVITAQTQFSKKILIALPLLLFFVLNIINPKYMQPFYNTTEGNYMLAITVVSMVFGTWMMNKISDIKF
ncbi:MAG: type II secretion system F family protein [Planctomycetota bacterium]